MHARRGRESRRWEVSWTLGILAGAISLLAGADAGSAAAWQPEQRVEIIVSTSPGSGSDVTARLVQTLLQDKRLVETPVTVVNKPGGGGAVALAYLTQQSGSGHHLFVTSPTLLTSRIAGTTTVNHTDLTPLAQIGSEYVVVSVRTESPIKSGKDLIARLRQDSGSLSFALANALGNHNHIAIAKLAETAGGDIRKLKVVVFNSSSEVVTSLLGGHVEVIASPPSSVYQHSAAGRVRILGVAAEHRLSGVLAAIPTWTEQGAKVVSSNWRSVVGPKGMTDGQVRFWDGIFARMVQQDEWKRDVETKLFENTYLGSADTRKLMDAQYAELGRILRALGLAR